MNINASKIQDSELEVMRVLWNAGGTMPLTQIRWLLSARCGWEDSTIKTLIRRLKLKGAVKTEGRGVYTAIVTEEEYSQWSTHVFINKLFAGSAKNLVASLVSDGQLSEDDIKELSAMFHSGDMHE